MSGYAGFMATIAPTPRSFNTTVTAVSESQSGSAFVALWQAFRVPVGTASGAIVGSLLEKWHVGDATGLAKLLFGRLRHE